MDVRAAMNPRVKLRMLPVCAIALAAWALSPLVLAQPGAAGPKGSPHYDANTEVTVRGTVEDVREQPCPNGRKCAGQHVTLRADAGSFDVHLGPADYWKKNGFELRKGDAIEVTGSRVTVDGKEALIAREVRKEENKVTLRDARGVPAWSRGRRSG